MPELKEVVFKDIPLSFSAHPVTGNLTVLKNADAVKNSVKNIVLTNFYERPYKPLLGGNVTAQLFENFTPFTEKVFSKNIRYALSNWEPRAIIDDVRVKPNLNNRTFEVTIVFRLKNSKEPITVQVLLERIR